MSADEYAGWASPRRARSANSCFIARKAASSASAGRFPRAALHRAISLAHPGRPSRSMPPQGDAGFRVHDAADHLALMREQVFGDGPSGVQLADEIRHRHFDVVEIGFAEWRLA